MSVNHNKGNNMIKLSLEDYKKQVEANLTQSWKERIRSFDDALRERLSRTFGKEIRRRGYGNSANYGLLIFETKKT